MSIENKIVEANIKRVLVIDSNNENILAAKSCFERYNSILNTYYDENPEDGLININQGEYDLILTDINFKINNKNNKEIIDEILKETKKYHQPTIKMIEIKYGNQIETELYFNEFKISSVLASKKNPGTWECTLKQVLDYPPFIEAHNKFKKDKTK